MTQLQIPQAEYAAAVARCPRQPDEPLEEWMERIRLAVRPEIGDRDLPRGDREPGSDDE